MENSKELLNIDENIIDATKYSDVQELICASDLLITDYSSIMFEAMIADKPVIVYANDINDYKEERGYYYSFDELPFPLTTNNDELMKDINNNDLEKIKEKYIEFANKVRLSRNRKSKRYNM